MSAMDSLNDRFGRGSVALSSAGLAGDRRSWDGSDAHRLFLVLAAALLGPTQI